VNPDRRSAAMRFVEAAVVARPSNNTGMTTGSSREGELPGSRRGLCLGCDALVVTARDAHVLFGGKRDGSFLAMFDAAPLLMLATDPDRLFGPGLELLGVAHRACVDLARQRLEAHEVGLPDELPRLIADEAVGDLPVLHLPPTSGRCAFCGDTEVTDEHVWPKWISRKLGGRHGFIIASPHGPRLRRHLGMTAPVCMACNNRWLSVLEKDVQPILGPLIFGKERSLPPDEQRLLATWAVKTALMLDLGSDRPIIPTGFYHDFRLRRGPLPNYLVWIGAYRDWHYAAWRRTKSSALGSLPRSRRTASSVPSRPSASFSRFSATSPAAEPRSTTDAR
jgi:hypothetical protein